MQGSGDQGIRGSGIRNQGSGISHRKKKMGRSERRTGIPDSSFIILHSAFASPFNPVYAGTRKGRRMKSECRMQGSGDQESVISHRKKMKKSECRTGMPDSSFTILHSAFALRFNPVYAGKRKGRRMKSECRMQGSGDQESVISNQSSQKNEEVRTQNGNARFIILHSAFASPFNPVYAGKRKGRRMKSECRRQGLGIRDWLSGIGNQESVIRNQGLAIAKKMKKSECRTGIPDSSFIILHSAFASPFNPVYAGKRKGRRMKSECRDQGIRNQGSVISHRKKNEEVRTKNGNTRFIIHHSSFFILPLPVV